MHLHSIVSALAAVFIIGCASATSAGPRLATNYVETPPIPIITVPVVIEPPGLLIDVGPITQEIIAGVRSKLEQRAESGDKEIWLRINSPGGEVGVGVGFISDVWDLKQKYKFRLRCVTTTHAASMGFAIFQNVCDDRYMTPSAFLMIHNSISQYRGNYKSIVKELESSLVYDELLARICSAKLKMSLEEYQAKIEDGDWLMAAGEALKIGAIDAIVDHSKLPAPYGL